MKTHILSPIRTATLLVATLLVFIASPASTRAATVTTPNLFSGETATGSSTYGGFPFSNVVSGSEGVSGIFADYTTVQNLSISGFNATSGIDSILFFDDGLTDTSRTETSVTIYYSSSALTSTTPGDYDADLGTFSLALTGNGGKNYATETYNPVTMSADTGYAGAGSTVYYDALTGLDIPVGTQSILFSFSGTQPLYHGYAGGALSAIEAFGPTEAAPEPSTYALMLLGGSLLLVLARRNRRIDV